MRLHKFLISNAHIPFVLLAAIIFAMHFFAARALGGDDVAFFGMFSAPQFNVGDYLLRRYETWSSRSLIEALMVPMILLPRIFWMVADSVLFAFLGALLVDLIRPQAHRTEISWLVSSLLVCFDFHDITDTGWITTTMNYLWPTVAALWVVRPLATGLPAGWKTKVRWLLLIPVTLFAANMELVCFVLIAVSICAVVHSCLQNRRPWYAGTVLLLSLMSLVYVLTCPGNSVRFAHDAGPEFLGLAYWEKVVIGASLVASKLYIAPNLLVIILSVVLAGLVMSLPSNRLIRGMGLVPLGFALGMVVLFLLAVYPALEHDKLRVLIDSVARHGVVLETNSIARLLSWGLLGLSAAAVVATCFLILLVLGPNKEGVVTTGVFILGMATKASLGFSPTAWSSGERTSFLLTVSLIFVIGSLLRRWDFDNRLASSLLSVSLGATALGAFGFHAMNLLSLKVLVP